MSTVEILPLKEQWDYYENRMRQYINGWFEDCRMVRELAPYVGILSHMPELINRSISDKISFTHASTDMPSNVVPDNKIKSEKIREKNHKIIYNKKLLYWNGTNLFWKSARVEINSKFIGRIIKKETGEYSFENLLPLPLTDVSKLVGKFRKYHGPYFEYGFNYECDIHYILCDVLPEYREHSSKYYTRIYPGSWDYSQQNLIDMATVPKQKFSINDLISGLKSRRHLELVMPNIAEYRSDSILALAVNGKAFPGIMTSTLLKSKLREHTTPWTKTYAYAFCDKIMNNSNYILDTSLVHVGGKEKRVKMKYGDPKQIKSRVTLCQEDVPLLISQSVSKLLTDYLSEIEGNYSFCGKNSYKMGFDKFVDDMKLSPGMINFSTDFSGHDNSVSEEAIVVAFSMLRCCLPESKKIDKLFYYIMSGMIYKRVVLPESFLVYDISKGIATGHSFTTLITTLVAYTTISTAMFKTMPESEIKRTRLCGAGDDWTGKMPITYLKAVSDCVNKESGCKCDDFNKTSGDITEFKYENKPTFLKKSYTYGFIHWNEFELFDNFIWRMYRPKASLNNRLLDIINHISHGPYSHYLTTCGERMIAYIIYKHYLLQYQPIPGLKALQTRINEVVNLMRHLNPLNIGITVKSGDIPQLRYRSKMAAIKCGFPRTIIVHNIISYWLNKLHRRVRISMKWHTLNNTYKKWDTYRVVTSYEKQKTFYEHSAYNIPSLEFIYERDIARLTNRVVQNKFNS